MIAWQSVLQSEFQASLGYGFKVLSQNQVPIGPHSLQRPWRRCCLSYKLFRPSSVLWLVTTLL